MNLYDEYPHFKILAGKGFPNIAEMAKHFISFREMDTALGYEKATSRWAVGYSDPGKYSERKAASWIANHNAEKARKDSPSNSAPPQPMPSGTMLLVICPQDQIAKTKRVLGLLGCEVEEV